MIEWYIPSADDDATCPKCKEFTLRRYGQFDFIRGTGHKIYWICTNCEYKEGYGMERWNNNACVGYAILAAEIKKKFESTVVTDKLDGGFYQLIEQIKKLVMLMYTEFDEKTIEEAEEKYRKSDY